jgi:hypothetical protein
MTLPLNRLIKVIYPRMYRVDNINSEIYGDKNSTSTIDVNIIIYLF